MPDVWTMFTRSGLHHHKATCNYGMSSFVMNRNVNIGLFSNYSSHIQSLPAQDACMPDVCSMFTSQDQSPKSPNPDLSYMPSNDVSCPYEHLIIGDFGVWSGLHHHKATCNYGMSSFVMNRNVNIRLFFKLFIAHSVVACTRCMHA